LHCCAGFVGALVYLGGPIVHLRARSVLELYFDAARPHDETFGLPERALTQFSSVPDRRQIILDQCSTAPGARLPPASLAKAISFG
jgi:hypothetical protein